MHSKPIWFSRERQGWRYKLIYEILILKQYNVVYVDKHREDGKWVGYLPLSESAHSKCHGTATAFRAILGLIY
jgi:hypothetical protein